MAGEQPRQPGGLDDDALGNARVLVEGRVGEQAALVVQFDRLGLAGALELSAGPARLAPALDTPRGAVTLAS